MAMKFFWFDFSFAPMKRAGGEGFLLRVAGGKLGTNRYIISLLNIKLLIVF